MSPVDSQEKSSQTSIQLEEGSVKRSLSLSKSLRELFKSNSPPLRDSSGKFKSLIIDKGKKISTYKGSDNVSSEIQPGKIIALSSASNFSSGSLSPRVEPNTCNLSSQESFLSEDEVLEGHKNADSHFNENDKDVTPVLSIDTQLSKKVSTNVKINNNLPKSQNKGEIFNRPRSSSNTNNTSKFIVGLQLKGKNRGRSATIGTEDLKEKQCQCVVEQDHFKVYKDGHHEHYLKIAPLVNHELPSKLKSTFSLSGFFKIQKFDNQVNDALPLLPPNDYELHQGLSLILDNEDCKKYNEDELDCKNPQIVNKNAAIGSQELKLINKLSRKINHIVVPDNISHMDGSVISNTELNNNSLIDTYGKSIGVIGHGAYGVVRVCCKAIDMTSNQINICQETYCHNGKLYYAVKEIRPKSQESQEQFSTRLTSEFVIGHSLSGRRKQTNPLYYNSHPNILKILDLMQTKDTFIEVMEFCPSGDLYSLLTRNSKSGTGLHPLEADCFMKQLLKGVQYMHKHGVAHCDLKPENILFKPNGTLKICDFGTSSVFQTAWEKRIHFQSGAVGSEPYVAPEEFIPNGLYDPRFVDCWSCGIIYCTMILGSYLWNIAIKEKDAVFNSYIKDMKTTGEFYIIEEMRHVNQDLNRYRKMCLYNILQCDPSRRFSVDKILESPWIKNVNCCITYEHCFKE